MEKEYNFHTRPLNENFNAKPLNDVSNDISTDMGNDLQDEMDPNIVLLQKKINMLQKLSELSKNGIILSKKYDAESSYEDMVNEYNYRTNQQSNIEQCNSTDKVNNKRNNEINNENVDDQID